jgi:hypothetical protein
MLCNSVVARMNAPRFRRARDVATQEIEKQEKNPDPTL